MLPIFAVASLSLAPATLGFAFSPAGLLFPYYIGVAYGLRELGLLQRSSPVGGSSAGAIVAAAVACGVSERDVIGALNALLEDVRGGTRLNVALKEQLSKVLSDDCHLIAQQHKLTVCYVEVLPWPRRRLVTEWKSKEDLMETIGASCNWPLFFSRWPLVWCRNKLCLDGFFATSRDRFGCPPLEAERTIAVTALPRVSLPAFEEADLIQPGGAAFADAPLPTGDTQWFRYATSPAPDSRVEEMVGLGRQHASMWAEAQASSA